MTDYQGNSKKSREGGQRPPVEEKRVERITSSEVIIQKKNLWQKFKGIVIDIDVPGLINFAIHEHVIPKSRNMLYDIIVGGAGRTIYRGEYPGGSRFRTPSSVLTQSAQRGITTYTPYNQPARGYLADPRGPAQLPPARPTDARHHSGYIITDRSEAEKILEAMAMVIDRYDQVTVADLHEMLGLVVSPIDHRWGWYDIREAQIRQIREGWVLEVPLPVEIPA